MASLFSLLNIIDKSMLTNPNYVDWLRNLQIRFVSEKNFDILDIPNLRLVSNNEKAKDIPMDIIYSFCGKLGYWENNCKDYLIRLK